MKNKCGVCLVLRDAWDGERTFSCELETGHKGKHKDSDKQFGVTGGEDYTEEWEIRWCRKKGFIH